MVKNLMMTKEVTPQTALTSLFAGHPVIYQDAQSIEHWQLDFAKNQSQITVTETDNSTLKENSKLIAIGDGTQKILKEDVKVYLPIHIADQTNMLVHDSRNPESQNELYHWIKSIYEKVNQESNIHPQVSDTSKTDLDEAETENLLEEDVDLSGDADILEFTTLPDDVEEAETLVEPNLTEDEKVASFNKELLDEQSIIPITLHVTNDQSKFYKNNTTNQSYLKGEVEDNHLPKGFFNIVDHIAVTGDGAMVMNNEEIHNYDNDVTEQFKLISHNNQSIGYKLRVPERLKGKKVTILLKVKEIRIPDRHKDDVVNEATPKQQNEIVQSSFFSKISETVDLITYKVKVPTDKSKFTSISEKGTARNVLIGYAKTSRIINQDSQIKSVLFNNKTLKRCQHNIDSVEVMDDNTLKIQINSVNNLKGNELTLTIRFINSSERRVGDERQSLLEASHKSELNTVKEEIESYINFSLNNGVWNGSTCYDKNKEPLLIVNRNAISLVTKSLNIYFDRKVTKYSKEFRNDIVHPKERRRTTPSIVTFPEKIPNAELKSYQCIRVKNEFLKEINVYNELRNKLYKIQ